MVDRGDIKDLGEVIDTERSTSRRNSIVQSERCGAHAEAMSEASRSGTRFLPSDINQLSRVTNAESKWLRHTYMCVYAGTANIQTTCFTICNIYTSSSNIRSCVSRPSRGQLFRKRTREIL